MKQDKIELKIVLPEGVSVKADDGMITVKGKKGELVRKIKLPAIVFKVEGNTLVISSAKPSQREKRLAYTMQAHLKNMIRGSNEGHTYRLKICSGHFPMNVAVTNKDVSVKNFLGEKIPRVAKIKEGVSAKMEGEIITVNGIDKEQVSQMAADIEKLTRITNRDKRIFQDGIFIIEKDGKAVE